MTRAALAIAAVVLAACAERIELDPGDDGVDAGTTLPACGVTGGACERDEGCCEGVCVDGACFAGCRSAGESCDGAADCCGASCESGVCVALSCGAQGERCSAAGDCCSRVCALAAGDEAPSCQALGGCAVAGDRCAQASDCCSGSCALDGALGRCATSESCVEAGEICRVVGDPAAAQECCPGGPLALALCRPSSVPGIDRCAGAASGTCSLPGTSCRTPDECCSGVCTGAAGALRCAAGCVLPGAVCTRSADCCTGTCSPQGICVGSSTCRSVGSRCALDAECCTGSCSPETRTCGALE